VRDIRELGRSTQGVTLIHLDSGAKLSSIEKIVETDEEEAADVGTQDISDEGASDEGQA
jgi:DNA gyrase subunit A